MCAQLCLSSNELDETEEDASQLGNAESYGKVSMKLEALDDQR